MYYRGHTNCIKIIGTNQCQYPEYAVYRDRASFITYVIALTHVRHICILFHNGSKGEPVKRGGGKTSDLLQLVVEDINIGNVDDSVTQDTYRCVHALNHTTDLCG